MKNIFYIVLIAFLSNSVVAQNRVNYSQYMHNHQIFNPAYVDHSSDFGASALYRNQWFGIQGAPASFIGDVFATSGKSNFNLQFLYDQITVFKHFEAGFSYSYTVKLGMATRLVFGAKASYNQQISNYDQLHYFDLGDPNLSGVVKKQGVNFGTGVFVRNAMWHAGLGAPYLFNNGNVDELTNVHGDVNYQHFFVTGGFRAVNERSLTFYPTTMLKWTKGSPANISLDMNFLINKLIWASVGYRTDQTLILSTGLVLANNFKLIYSYDLGLGKVNRFGGMTHEISMGYGMEVITNSFVKRKYVKRNRTTKGSKTPRRWRK
jgi:type IX secretion system PorP/SprF family membrane protein